MFTKMILYKAAMKNTSKVWGHKYDANQFNSCKNKTRNQCLRQKGKK